MPRNRREGSAQSEPQIDPETGIALLKQQIDRARALLSSRPLRKDSYSSWELLTGNYLEKAFGKDSPNINAVLDAGKYGAFPMNVGEEWWENHRHESLTTQVERLRGLVELLETEARLQQTGTAPSQVKDEVAGLRIFLVHGRDEGSLHEAARYLERLAQKVVILREEPNAGKTVIEKFEKYSDVGFAVVLLTPDDRGGPVDQSVDLQQKRARQNVILELGFFLGKLGRSRVCALYCEGVEVPSDYSGVLYVKLDSGGAWRFVLAKELKAAGFPVDMNKAL